MLGQADSCKYTTILQPGKSKLLCLRVPFYTSLDIMNWTKLKNFPCFSLILCAIFLGCTKGND